MVMIFYQYLFHLMYFSNGLWFSGYFSPYFVLILWNFYDFLAKDNKFLQICSLSVSMIINLSIIIIHQFISLSILKFINNFWTTHGPLNHCLKHLLGGLLSNLVEYLFLIFLHVFEEVSLRKIIINLFNSPPNWIFYNQSHIVKLKSIFLKNLVKNICIAERVKFYISMLAPNYFHILFYLLTYRKQILRSNSVRQLMLPYSNYLYYMIGS